MSRYIKFDDAVKVMACEMYAEAQSQGYDADGIEDFMPEATAWLNDAPSIDIVFCKECMYYAEHNELYINAPTNCVKHSTINHYVVVNADDFCSYGQKR